MSACRGCTGTCCTGVGSDPCVCPDEYTDDGDQLTTEQSAAERRLGRRAFGLQSPAERLAQAREYGHKVVVSWLAKPGLSDEQRDERVVRGLVRYGRRLHSNGHLNNPEMVAAYDAIRESALRALGL